MLSLIDRDCLPPELARFLDRISSASACTGSPIPPPPNAREPRRQPVTLESMKAELARVDARKATLEKQIAYIEANPGALELLQEIAGR